MTSQDPKSPAPGDGADQAAAPDQAAGQATDQYRDRVYRSPGGVVGGVLLLALVGWLGTDALVRGDGRLPWLALASVLFLLPLVVAFTLRPAVFANEERMRVRNPFRVITLPWSQVVSLRAGYSNEVVAESGAKYQLWALPVSLRGRKRAASRQARAARDTATGLTGSARAGTTAPAEDHRAASDRVMDELRELRQAHAAHATDPGAQGEAEVRWAYEILGPSGAGAVLLAILTVVG